MNISKPTAMISRRTLLKVSSAAVGGTLLTGLAAPAIAQGNNELTIMIAQPHVGGAEIAARTFEERTGIKVTIVSVPMGAMYQQVALDQQSGANVFDLYQNWYPTIGALAANGLAVDITDYIERDRDTVQPDDFIQNVYDAYSLYEDRRFALPYDADNHALYFNKELLERLGAELPKTWDELNALAERATNELSRDGIHGHSLMGMPIPLMNVSTFANRVANMGASFLDAEGNPALNTPAILAAAENYAAMAPHASPTPPEIGYAEGLALFLGGRVVTKEGWMDLALNAQQDPDSVVRDKWGVAMLPTLSGNSADARAALNAGFGISISPQSEKQELAWEFLKWITGPEMCLEMSSTNATGIDPFRVSTLDSPIYQAAAPNSHQIVRDSLANAMAWPTGPDAPQLMEVLSRDLAVMLSGQRSPTDTMNGVQRAWERLLR